MIAIKKIHWTLKALIVSVGVGVLTVGWWFISPLFIDKEVNEALPAAVQMERSGDKGTEDMKGDSSLTKQSKESLKPEAEMKEAVKQAAVAYTGSFVDGEPGHHAKGKAITLADSDVTILRLEELEATNGPDLHLFLAKPGGKISEGINLGKLKGNLGNQNYELPADVDLSIYSNVVIYCKQFSVDFGYAELKKS